MSESIFYHGDRYFANSYDATIARRRDDEKAQRMAERIARVLARRLIDREADRVNVDGETYVEALELLGDAWTRRSFLRFRSVVGYVANVELERAVDEVAQWNEGVRAWRRGERSLRVA